MNREKFLKCFNLWREDASSDISIIVSGNEDVTAENWEARTEWRQPYRNSIAEPISQPAEPTYAQITAFSTAADSVADYSN